MGYVCVIDIKYMTSILPKHTMFMNLAVVTLALNYTCSLQCDILFS